MGRVPPQKGKKVRFRAPKGVAGGLKGEVVDEVWASDSQLDAPKHVPDHDLACWGDYAFCSQLIKWDNGGYSIR